MSLESHIRMANRAMEGVLNGEIKDISLPIAILHHAQELYPDEPRIHLTLANFYYSTENFDAALIYARNAWQLGLRTKKHAQFTSDLHCAAREYEQAAQVLSQAIEELPAFASLHSKRAMIRYHLKDSNAAIEDVKMSMKVGLEDNDTLGFLGAYDLALGFFTNQSTPERIDELPELPKMESRKYQDAYQTVFFSRSNTYLILAKYHLAEQEALKAIQLETKGVLYPQNGIVYAESLIGQGSASAIAKGTRMLLELMQMLAGNQSLKGNPYAHMYFIRSASSLKKLGYAPDPTHREFETLGRSLLREDIVDIENKRIPLVFRTGSFIHDNQVKH